jgi:hypothetical protein
VLNNSVKYNPWNNQLGWWSNAIDVLRNLGTIIPQADNAAAHHQLKSLSTTSIEIKKGDGGVKPAQA